MPSPAAPSSPTRDALIDTLVAFIRGLGLQVRLEARDTPHPDGRLPGCWLEPGTIVVDPARLEWPGDLLHEAGHLAVMTPSERARAGALTGSTDAERGQEMAAMAWSYAAAVHLGVAPEVVFHEGGYRGGSDTYVEAFSRGAGPGVPLLAWFGLTRDPPRPTRDAADAADAPYPAMRRWLRAEPAPEPTSDPADGPDPAVAPDPER